MFPTSPELTVLERDEMAKAKKPQRKPDPQRSLITLKGDPAWLEWLKRYADALGVATSTAIDIALASRPSVIGLTSRCRNDFHHVEVKEQHHVHDNHRLGPDRPDPRPSIPNRASCPGPEAGGAERRHYRLQRRDRPQPGSQGRAGVLRDRSRACPGRCRLQGPDPGRRRVQGRSPLPAGSPAAAAPRMSALERNAALHRMAAANEQIASAITLDVVARQNARMGYSTPVLNTYGPGVTPYGPYGAVMYPNAGAPSINPQAQGQAALESLLPR